MRKAAVAAGVIVVVGAGTLWIVRRGHATETQNATVGANGAVRQAVELTVYSQDFGMVHETRPMQITAGSNRLHVPDVSRQLDPQSVLLGWQGATAANAQTLPQLVANSYDLGIGNGDALLKRYLGQQVEMVRYGQDGHEAERQKGTLMINGGSQVVLESEGKFYVNPQGTVVAPTSPDIVTIPQLSVQADAAAAQSASLEVTYLTRGMSWSADYVAVLSPRADTLTLECWATVVNRTGVNYPEAKVSLAVGTPNRAAVQAEDKAEDSYISRRAAAAPLVPGMMAEGSMRKMAAPEAVGDNYMYKIDKPTTVVQDQMNRLLMLSSNHVAVKKDYSTQAPTLTAWDDISYGWGVDTQSKRGHVAVSMTLFNREANGLGQPLPQGAIRMYETDAGGSLRYAGAAGIDNTPKDARADLTLAQAFDLYTEWNSVKTQKLSKHTLRKQITIVLHNEKAVTTPIRVAQSFEGRWKIVKESTMHRNLNAQQTDWTVTVPAGGTTRLTYTVDFTI